MKTPFKIPGWLSGNLFPTLLFAALLVAALANLERLHSWFALTPPGDKPPSAAKSATPEDHTAHSGLQRAADGTVSHEGHGHLGSDTAFYTCSMHPSVKQATPGACPICSMDLLPVSFEEKEGGTILVDSVRRQRIGVRVGPVEQGMQTKHLRLVGMVDYDETKLVDVSPKYAGWIEKLYADTIGMPLKRGEPLFAAYSPEVYTAQGDMLAALSAPALLGKSESSGEAFLDLARERLRLLNAQGLEAHLKKSGKPTRYVMVMAPADGFLVEKKVVQGGAFTAGSRVMRIAGLDTVWLQAELYESDLALVKEGQKVSVTLPYLPGKRYEAAISYVEPFLQMDTRTGRARIELANPDLELKPGMYADVELEIPLGTRLLVPDSAVVYTGTRRLVFVDLGEGRLQPRVVRVGAHADGRYEVLSGLSLGDQVVTSGTFLIAAESRLRSAAAYWGADEDVLGAARTPAEPAVIEVPSASAASPPSAAAPPLRTKPAPRGPPAPPAAPPASGAATSAPAAAPLYVCPMHSHITSHKPGKCPICHMDLELRTK